MLASDTSGGGEGGGSQADVLKRLKFLRVVRCLRLVKLMRLLRASRMMARWETRISINYGFLSLWKMFLAYILLAHWSGCLLVLPTTFYDNVCETWLGYYGYCIAEPSGGIAYHPVDIIEDECHRVLVLTRGLHINHTRAAELLDSGACIVRCESPASLFAAAVYFSLQMICGATGGELQRNAFNAQEQILFAILVIVGALLWGQVIGTFVSVIANARPDLAWFRSTMDQLNAFMSIHGLPTEMRMRLREYFQQSRHVQRGQERKRILRLMSPQLQGEVALAINRRWIESIRFLKGAETELIVLVACSLQPAVFCPGELATPGHLYVIHKGIALYAGRLLTSGKCWGHDMILANQQLCHYTARAMSYLEVYRISRSDLLELARPFPVALRRIRWEAVRLAIMRSMTHTKRAMAEQKKLDNIIAQRVLDAAAEKDGDGNSATATATPSWNDEGGEGGALSVQTPESPAAAPAGEAGNVWHAFMEQVTTTPAGMRQGGMRISGGITDPKDVPAMDPTALLEKPSLNDLNREVMQVRMELIEMKETMAELVKLMKK